MQLIDAETGEIEGRANGQALALVDDKFQFMPTGLIIQDDPTFEEWEECGQLLGHIQKRIHWWIGDWLNYGEGRWPDRYAQALDRWHFNYQTLRDDRWVAGKVDMSLRKDKLSFSHHKEVASLPPPEQKDWLERAEREDLTTRELREQIRQAKEEEIYQVKNPGHFPECWRYVAHHACAVALIKRLRAALTEILDEAEGDLGRNIIATAAKAALASGGE